VWGRASERLANGVLSFRLTLSEGVHASSQTDLSSACDNRVRLATVAGCLTSYKVVGVGAAALDARSSEHLGRYFESIAREADMNIMNAVIANLEI